MGVVYRAEQVALRRAVALKVIASAFVTSELLRRFEHEAATLARLKHPGIAQIYEAGIARDANSGGTIPFFAMELIEGGLPLDRFAEAGHLSTRKRLELLAKVCDAVQYAHQQGIIHRDLKPANVLVTQTGEPKVIDFGVARTTNSDVNVTTMHTDVRQLIGTLAYMSPEQAGGETEEIDTRSDVYALGVIAYQLLAGRLPYELGKRMIHDAVRVIREDEPSRLSSIDKTFRGDVETIVAKALDKQKDRRYSSAADFAADVRRYLSDQPITARPAGTWYGLKKFARRNRALVGGIVATFVMLLLGLTASTLLAIRATRQERIAESRRIEAEQQRAEADRQRTQAVTQAQTAREVSDFLVGMFEKVSPEQAMGRTITAVEAVSGAVDELSSRLNDRDEVKASLELALGRALVSLGKPSDAALILKDSADRRRRTLGPDHPDTLASLTYYAAAVESVGRPAEAEAILGDVLDRRRRLLGPDHPDTLLSLTGYGFILNRLSRNEEAVGLFKEAVEGRRRVLGPDHPDTLLAENNYAVALRATGHVEEAESLLKSVIERRTRISGPDHPDTISALRNEAALLLATDRASESAAVFKDVLDRSVRVLGEDHPTTAEVLQQYAEALAASGHLDQADAAFKSAIDKAAPLGPDHPRVARLLQMNAEFLISTNRRREANTIYERLLERHRRVLGPEHRSTLTLMNDYSLNLAALGRAAEAEPMLKSVLETRTRLLGPDDKQTIASVNNYAFLLMSMDRPADSEPYFRRSLEGCRRTLGESNIDTLRVLSNYGYVLARIGRADESEKVFLEAAHRAATQPSLGLKHPETKEFAQHAVDVLEALDRLDEAKAVRLEFDLSQPASAPMPATVP